jgi:hypothetical protein
MRKMMKQMTTGRGPFGRMAAMMGRGGAGALPEGVGGGNGPIHVPMPKRKDRKKNKKNRQRQHARR